MPLIHIANDLRKHFYNFKLKQQEKETTTITKTTETNKRETKQTEKKKNGEKINKKIT